MRTLLVVVRALHFAAAITLFGQFAFAYCVARERRLIPGGRALAAASLALAIVTALAWLAIEAGHMSGMPVGEALREGVWRVVLGRTLFGHVWLLRGVLALLIAAALLAMAPHGEGPRRAAQALAAACAALFLASLACAGHAAGDTGANRVMHVAADGLHLLAAGGWLGALLPLVVLLRARGGDAPSPEDAAQAARRFSVLGMACVGTLALTGFVNACYALHRVSELFTSDYGRVLLAKLVLVAAILALAVVNRGRLTPRLAATDNAVASTARRALASNALAEVALGFAIVGIVGALGITMPPMHMH